MAQAFGTAGVKALEHPEVPALCPLVGTLSAHQYPDPSHGMALRRPSVPG